VDGTPLTTSELLRIKELTRGEINAFINDNYIVRYEQNINTHTKSIIGSFIRINERFGKELNSDIFHKSINILYKYCYTANPYALIIVNLTLYVHIVQLLPFLGKYVGYIIIIQNG
jgi:hypothetical protein